MRRTVIRWLAIGAMLGIVALLAFLWFRPKTPAERGDTQSPEAPVPGTSAGNASRLSGVEARSGLAASLNAAAAALKAAETTDQKKASLALLRQALAGISTNEASGLIRRFLDTKADAPTGQGFKISDQGNLEESPTLRTFLLDYLGQVDPAAAAAYARTILSRADSPDEWAVALRNLARGDASPEARALLGTKTAELLRNESWQQSPSVGYLEAFDTVVHLAGTNLLPALTDLVRREDNPAVAHAAFLTLDRLVINDPAAQLSVLHSSPALLQGREATRAGYFARADVRDPGQRQLLEAYLLDPHTGGNELGSFASVFPNANFMISHNLLTAVTTPDRATLVARDAAALSVVREWLTDPRFTKLRPELEKVKGRLEEFARQSSGK